MTYLVQQHQLWRTMIHSTTCNIYIGNIQHAVKSCELYDITTVTSWLADNNNEFRLQLEMWANAQRDGRPVEHRWRPLFNAVKFGWRPLLDAVQKRCQDAKPIQIWRGAPTGKPISAATGPKFTILRGHVEDILLLNKFFSDCRYYYYYYYY